MSEPMLFHIPLSTLFLYFIVYSFLGWCVETTYCCAKERRWVARGFLFGPVCPIYGVGVLLMLLFFAPLMDRPALFYFIATLVMTGWEYLVGLFLELTTHIKYWDYSDMPLNLHGRVCLPVSLCWGTLSYMTLFFLHPHVASLLDGIPLWLRYSLFGAALTLFTVDVVTTLRHLSMTVELLARLEVTAQELRLQTAFARAELSDRLEKARKTLDGRLRDSDRLAALKARYQLLLDQAEEESRRFRQRYPKMHSTRFDHRMREVSSLGSELAARIRSAQKAWKTRKKQ